METVNQENNVATEEQKTFTQEELNKIVSERLGRERQKYADYEDLKAKATRLDEIEEASKTELQKQTERAEALQAELDQLKSAEAIRVMRTSVAQETGIPVELLTETTEEACKQQAQAIKAYAQPGYPNVRDGGEVQNMSKASPADSFAQWMQTVMN